MNTPINFAIGSTSTLGIGELFNEQSYRFVENLQNVTPQDISYFTTWDDVLKYLISILGGILASIVLNFLKQKFPKLFGELKKRKRGKLD